MQTGPNGTAATLTAKILEDLQNISGTISSVQNLQVYAHKSTCIHFTVVSILFAHSTVFRCTSKEIFLTLKWTLMGAKVKYVITHSQNVYWYNGFGYPAVNFHNAPGCISSKADWCYQECKCITLKKSTSVRWSNGDYACVHTQAVDDYVARLCGFVDEYIDYALETVSYNSSNITIYVMHKL